MRTTFNFQFYCRESKANKKTRLSHIEVSLSINGVRKYITLPFTCKPQDFNKLRKPKIIQEYLNSVTNNINQFIVEFATNGIELTTDNLSYAIINGSISKTYLVSNLFDEYNKLIQQRDISFGQIKKYLSTNELFIECVGNKSANMVSNADILTFQTFIYNRYAPNTAAGHIVRLKAYFKYAKDNNKIDINPTSSIRVRRDTNKSIVFLTQQEYDKLKYKDMHSDRLNKVRDLWIFQASCGLSFCDMVNLSQDDIQTSPDGLKYITKERCKTGVKYTSVLLQDAIEILEKYNWKLPLLSNQRYNSYLQECIDIACINKHITTHTARHQYATRLLASGIPITTIQHCLGHSSVLVTQKYYAALQDETIIREIKNGMPS